VASADVASSATVTPPCPQEEAETLREALHIAAMDIAEAAESDLEGGDSDGDGADG
jgi:hypothetical protein